MSFAPPPAGPDHAGEKQADPSAPIDDWPAYAPPADPPPAWPAAPSQERSRTPIYVALFLVAVLSGSALFVSGFTLGLQQSLSPGTSAGDQALFGPFWEAYHKISAEYVGSYAPKDLVEGAIKGMFGALDDPYSSYMTPEEYEASLQGLSGEFEGIGAHMAAEDGNGAACSPFGPDCALLVVGLVAGSPAEHGGLLAGDMITAVDGRPVAGRTLGEMVTRVKGPKGTDVRLSIIRNGKDLELTLTRDVIKTEDVTSVLLADGTVGYLRVAGFSNSAADDFRGELKAMLDVGVRRFVVDLRDDPGGFVDAARSIASEFVGSGPIYWEEHADGQLTPTAATADGLATDPGIGVVVLVNGGSASASEIVAGALHDTGRARLVGTTTFGKGTIQQWHLLSPEGESGGFRLSVAKWLTPNKSWIHGVGITPDVRVELPADTPAGQDPQLDKALELLAPAPGASPAATASATPRPGGSPAARAAPGAGPSSSDAGDILIGLRRGLRRAA